MTTTIPCLSLLGRTLLCAALSLPVLALAADATTAPAASAGGGKKMVKKAKAGADAKAGGGDSAPGCDEANGAGKKGPSLPKCPDAVVKKKAAAS
jgi:hypothetical protein